MKIVSKVTNWYGKYERPVSSLSLIGGFVFDAIALKRIDMFWENLWILGHLLIVAVFMILVHTTAGVPGDEANPQKTRFWLVNILQFVFGGLLSVFLVFYFRSSDLSTSWPFIIILALAFWANESFKRQFVRLTFQVSLFFLSVFLSSIFLVPVVIHEIGTRPFIFSGLISLAVMYIFLAIISRFKGNKLYKSKNSIILSVAIIFVGMNILYFTNLIPPIPLSLKESGIFHSITRDTNGNYIAKYEDVGWLAYVKLHDDFHIVSGMPAYAYSAVFSPTNLNTTIYHEWQYYDETAGKWIDSDRFGLPISGGRESGFRTYSVKTDLAPGKWRVNVATPNGQVVGRLRFTVINSNSFSSLKTKVLQ